MMVKVCGITNWEDASAASECGASALGFNFWRYSPRYISPTGASLIAEKLPASILKVGVFVDETPDVIAKVALQANLDIAQLHGASECPAVLRWRACLVGETLEVDCLADLDAAALLLDTASAELRGGTGLTFRWSLAKQAAQTTGKKIVIAGGLDQDNVQSAIAEAQPWGVDSCSRLESSPGRKDHVKMKKFIRAALAA
ncbi:MAG: phosphoribosylanthranilate isomerase [Acidobacteriota bacterium]|nr:phosphoribosylanthranilate isomerase [Acidobacteriota bacterium]